MSQITSNPGSENISPAVHLEFIQNQAGLAEGAGVAEVEAYHRALFLHHHAREMERFQQQAHLHQDRLAHLENRLKQTRLKLAGLEEIVPVEVDGKPDVQPVSPWNNWDRAMFVTALLGIVGLLVFGVLNISFNLLESGLVTFIESPIRAYFWAALLPVGALAVKIGWDVLQSARARRWYLWFCLGVGVAGILVWVGAYGVVYPTLSKSTEEQIAAMSVFDEDSANASTTAEGAKWIDVVTVTSQAVAEIFVSALLGIYMTMLYARHRPVRLASNPVFDQIDQERRTLEVDVERERLGLADARGNLTRLENQLTALVAFARSMFQKESALKRDQTQQKRQLLDQLSDQLRSQLQVIENSNHGTRFNPQASLGAANGQ